MDKKIIDLFLIGLITCLMLASGSLLLEFLAQLFGNFKQKILFEKIRLFAALTLVSFIVVSVLLVIFTMCVDILIGVISSV